jgi:hypothetical protein
MIKAIRVLSSVATLFAIPFVTLAQDSRFSFAVIGDHPYVPTVTVAGVTRQVYPAPKFGRIIRFPVHPAIAPAAAVSTKTAWWA